MDQTPTVIEASMHDQALPPELMALVRGRRQLRWLLSMQSPEGLHHSEGKRSRWAGSLHDDIGRFVHRCRCAGWEVRVSRLGRGTDRYFLETTGGRDSDRGEAYIVLGQAAPQDLVAELCADAELRARAAEVAVAVGRNYWRELETTHLVDLARRLTDEQIEVMAALLDDATLEIEDLAEAAGALAPDR